MRRFADTTFTKQGVRNLNDPPSNTRKRKASDGCIHEYDHSRDCAGCWGERFGGYERAPHEYVCRKCKHPMVTDGFDP